ncbi:MAG: hypothetical protein ACI85Q_001046 [Salibacteraceae bacterium]|jgi:hypothetical protein
MLRLINLFLLTNCLRIMIAEGEFIIFDVFNLNTKDLLIACFKLIDRVTNYYFLLVI